MIKTSNTQRGKRCESDSAFLRNEARKKINEETIVHKICSDKICFVILLNCLPKYIMVSGKITFNNGIESTNTEERFMILINE